MGWQEVLKLMRMFCYIVGLWLMLPMASSQAAFAHHLYDAKISVVNRSQKALQRALPRAYQQVLIKVSGNPGIMTLPSVKKTAVQISQIVQSYDYLISRDEQNQPVLKLNVHFDASMINQVLQQSGQGIWTGERPLILVWLGFFNRQTLTLLTNDSDTRLLQILKDNAQRRGLPILLPMDDLQDMTFITPTSVAQLQQQAILSASQRYHPDDILAGSVYQDVQGMWRGNWLFIFNDQKITWQTQGKTAQQVIANVIDRIANTMASQYAVLTSQALTTQLTVKILNVSGLSAYLHAVSYLRKLAPVTNVVVLDVNPNDLLVSLFVVGGEMSLMQTLQNSTKVAVISEGDMENQQPNVILRWLGLG